MVDLFANQIAGVSVAQVARRYAINANLIHNWLRDPRFVPDDESENQASDFLPVEIEGATSASCHQSAALAGDMPLAGKRVDITLSHGRRMSVEGTTALPTVLALVEGLMP